MVTREEMKEFGGVENLTCDEAAEAAGPYDESYWLPKIRARYQTVQSTKKTSRYRHLLEMVEMYVLNALCVASARGDMDAVTRLSGYLFIISQNNGDEKIDMESAAEELQDDLNDSGPVFENDSGNKTQARKDKTDYTYPIIKFLLFFVLGALLGFLLRKI